MKKAIFWILGSFTVFNGLLYAIQEKFIFHPTILHPNHVFDFSQLEFEEHNIPVGDDYTINALHFTVPEPKGLIFYCHGNAGDLDRWGDIAKNYVDLGYDFVVWDYRGYGKSLGRISSEKELLADADLVFNFFKNKNEYKKNIVIGYSLGSGIASYLTQQNQVDCLILQAPYFSMKRLIQEKLPILIPPVIKYKINTRDFMAQHTGTTYLFHGSDDGLIPVSHAHDLKASHSSIHLHILQNQGHNGMNENETYKKILKEIL